MSKKDAKTVMWFTIINLSINGLFIYFLVNNWS